MILTLDASVAVKLFYDEDGSAEARRIVKSSAIVAPEILLIELHHALWKRLRRREISAEMLGAILPAMRAGIERLEPLSGLIDNAVALSMQHDHPIYDCLYVALALRERTPLVTADTKQASMAVRAGLSVQSV